MCCRGCASSREAVQRLVATERAGPTNYEPIAKGHTARSTGHQMQCDFVGLGLWTLPHLVA